LLELEFALINDFFKDLKDDSHLENSLLPPYELIIEEAQKIYIPEDKIKKLFQRHRPKPIKPVTPRPKPRTEAKVEK
jgi:hypothetical protein